jgi:hypothetical protein
MTRIGCFMLGRRETLRIEFQIIRAIHQATHPELLG